MKTALQHLTRPSDSARLKCRTIFRGIELPIVGIALKTSILIISIDSLQIFTAGRNILSARPQLFTHAREVVI
jgi:hypothetical protein